MNSTKLGSLNPLIQENKMTQKLVTYADYNKLWDDVDLTQNGLAAAVTALYAAIAAIPTGGIPVTDQGLFVNCSLVVTSGVNVTLTANAGGDAEAKVFGSDLVTSVHKKTGSGALVYGIKLNADPLFVVVDTDLSALEWSFTFADAGNVVLLDLGVSDDNGVTWTVNTAFVEVKNPIPLAS